jgi:hypothetical protein
MARIVKIPPYAANPTEGGFCLQGGDHPVKKEDRAADDAGPYRFAFPKPLLNQVSTPDFC